jgi:hypothetical protein
MIQLSVDKFIYVVNSTIIFKFKFMKQFIVLWYIIPGCLKRSKYSATSYCNCKSTFIKNVGIKQNQVVKILND